MVKNFTLMTFVSFGSICDFVGTFYRQRHRFLYLSGSKDRTDDRKVKLTLKVDTEELSVC